MFQQTKAIFIWAFIVLPVSAWGFIEPRPLGNWIEDVEFYGLVVILETDGLHVPGMWSHSDCGVIQTATVIETYLGDYTEGAVIRFASEQNSGYLVGDTVVAAVRKEGFVSDTALTDKQNVTCNKKLKSLVQLFSVWPVSLRFLWPADEEDYYVEIPEQLILPASVPVTSVDVTTKISIDGKAVSRDEYIHSGLPRQFIQSQHRFVKWRALRRHIINVTEHNNRIEQTP